MAYTEITPDVVTAFRTTMAAFSDWTKWPDAIVNQALNEADAETGGAGWGSYGTDPRNFKRRGMFYFAAHWLAITYLTQTAADASNISPTTRLNLNGKSVGDESVQFRMTAIQDTADDWLSTTIYGVEYYRLRKRAGMGARAV